MINFDPVEHRYYSGDVRYISVTQLTDLVKNKFDAEQESVRMAEMHGHTPEYWKNKWKAKSESALVTGNELHDRKEEIDLARGIIQVGDQDVRLARVQNPERISSIEQDYWYWPPGMYPELLLWNHGVRLAGRADRVYLSSTLPGGARIADIEDHKTNEKIDTRSWYDYKTGKYRMLKPPLDHLMDCTLIHYALQLSLYQWLLEQMGFAPGFRRILHYPALPPDMGPPGARARRPRITEVPYLRQEVEALIAYGLQTSIF